jgi:L-alanine-DL-glutamate epimerase-like enolase superfamily enzyme
MASPVSSDPPGHPWNNSAITPPPGREIAGGGFDITDGFIDLPTAPGLGLLFDEAALERHALRERRPRQVRQYYEE